MGNRQHALLATVEGLCKALGIAPHLIVGLVSPTMKSKDWMSTILLMTACSNSTYFFNVKQEVRLERWWRLVGEWQGWVLKENSE